MSISDITRCSVDEPQAAALMHISPLSQCLPLHPQFSVSVLLASSFQLAFKFPIFRLSPVSPHPWLKSQGPIPGSHRVTERLNTVLFKSAFNVYEHAAGEFFLTFSFCQLWSAFLGKKMHHPSSHTSWHCFFVVFFLVFFFRAALLNLSSQDWPSLTGKLNQERVKLRLPLSHLAVGKALVLIWEI